MPATKVLRSKREAIVIEHMESENRHEFDVALATFDHPRQELIPTGDVYDGPREVAAYYEETRAALRARQPRRRREERGGVSEIAVSPRGLVQPHPLRRGRARDRLR